MFYRHITGGWVLGLYVVLLAIKYVYALETVQDVAIQSDDPVYLERGVQFMQHWGKIDPSWSPLYSGWYYLLSFLTTDRLELYFLNHKLLIVGTTALIYMLLRGLQVNELFAAVAAVVYLVSNVPIATPYNGLFALLIVLVFLNWAVRMSSVENTYLVAGIGIALVVFVRPEYLASLVLLAFWLAFWYFRRGGAFWHPARVGKIAALLVLVVGLFGTFGNPLGGVKGFRAFMHCFYIRHIIATDPPSLGPGGLYAMFQSTDLWQAFFGDAQSITSAAMHNTPAFTQHVLSNVGTYLLASLQFPFVTPLAFLSAGMQSSLAVAQLGLVMTLLVCLWRALARGMVPLRDVLPGHFLVLVLLICAPSVLVSLLYAPRWNYLVVQTALLLVCCCAVLAAVLQGRMVQPRSVGQTLVFGVVLLAVAPNHVHGWFLKLRSDAVPAVSSGQPLPRYAALEPQRQREILGRQFGNTTPSPALFAEYWLAQPFRPPQALAGFWPQHVLEDRTTIVFMRALPIEQRINLFAAGPYATYLGSQYRPVPLLLLLKQPLATFLREAQIDMILVTENLKSAFGHDQAFVELLAHPEEYGFVRLEIPGTANTLLIKNAVLPLQLPRHTAG